jgi:DNA-binding transcriptional LysR family regulator
VAAAWEALAWLADVLSRIADIPQGGLHELLPWHWAVEMEGRKSDGMIARPLVDAVQAFEAMFPTVKLRPHVEALSAVAQLVRNGMAMVGVGGGVLATEPDLELIHVGDVEMISGAAPHHPLALARPVPAAAARRHRQLILTVRTPFSEGPDVGVFAADEWRLADLGAKHALLLAGVGWGNMPEPNIRDDLAAGRLVRLELPEARSGTYSFQAMYRTSGNVSNRYSARPRGSLADPTLC